MVVFLSKQTGEIAQKFSREERKGNLVERKHRQVRNQEIGVPAQYPRVSKIVVDPKSWLQMDFSLSIRDCPPSIQHF